VSPDDLNEYPFNERLKEGRVLTYERAVPLQQLHFLTFFLITMGSDIMYLK
jgi:hypothetical protein